MTLSIVRSPTKEGEVSPNNVGTVDFQWDEEKGRSVKRARRNSSPGPEIDTLSRDADSRKRTRIREVLGKLDSEGRNLSKLVHDNTNTKKEIKEAARAIRSLMSIIQTSEMQELIFNNAGKQEREEEIATLRKQLNELTSKREQGNKELGMCRRCRLMPEIDTDMEDIEGNEIQGRKEKKKERERIEQRNSLKPTEIKIGLMERKIEAIMSAIERMEKGEDRRETGPNPIDEGKRTMAEVVEGEKRDKEIKKPGNKGKEETIGIEQGKEKDKKKAKEESKSKEGKPSFRYKRERVVIRTEGEYYANMLKRIKEGTTQEIGDKIRGARKSKAGNIVLELGKGTDSTEVERELQKIVGEEKAKITSGSRVMLEVKGVEEGTTTEEVMDAIEKQMEKGSCRVKWIKTYGKDLRIARIEANRRDATKLLAMGHLKVGWTRCRIQERPDKPRPCNRCWAYGHRGEECKGLDRRGNCHRCGEAGHKEMECEREPTCLACKDKGWDERHFRGSKGCQAQKEAMDKGKSG